MRHSKSRLTPLSAFLCILTLAACTDLGNPGGSSSDASLSALSVSSGSLAPAFVSTKTSYTITVPNATASLTISATPAKAKASVAGTGIKALNVGLNTFTVQVTAEDGVTTKTYTIGATRAAALSNDARLASLSLSAGTLSPSFDPLTTSYSANVQNSVTSVSVTASASASGAGLVTSGGSALAVGANTVTVTVTAPDGTTQKTYTITVNRAATVASSDASLSGLSLSAGSLDPVFSATTYSYTASVENGVDILSVTATPTDSGASAAAGAFSLDVGSNTLNIVVTAADGLTTKTYAITVTRAASSDAVLSGLALSVGSLSPSFSSTTTDYSVTVATTVSSITVTGTARNAGASVGGNGTTTLAVGENAVTLVVTAADGTTKKTYTLTVTRAAPAASNVSSLASLSVKDGSTELLTGFASGTHSYDITVEYAVYSLRVSATTTSAGATVVLPAGAMGPGVFALEEGVNTAEVVVTAEDGVSMTAYTLNVTREAATTSLAITSPARGDTMLSGTNAVISGTWSGVAPANIFVNFCGASANAIVNVPAKTWSASLDITVLPNSKSASIFAIARDGSNVNGPGQIIAVATSEAAITGSSVPGYVVTGSLAFAGTQPSHGSLWVMMNIGSRMVAKPIPLPTADLSFSIDGIVSGTGMVSAIYSTTENLDFFTAYMTALSGGDVLYGYANCVVSADTTTPTITLP